MIANGDPSYTCHVDMAPMDIYTIDAEKLYIYIPCIDTVYFLENALSSPKHGSVACIAGL